MMGVFQMLTLILGGLLGVCVIGLIVTWQKLNRKNDLYREANKWRTIALQGMYEANKWRKIALQEKKKSLGGGTLMNTDFTKQEVVFMLKKCHPDHNDNSEISNGVTQKLNAMK